jgi:hypothetical protein
MGGLAQYNLVAPLWGDRATPPGVASQERTQPKQYRAGKTIDKRMKLVRVEAKLIHGRYPPRGGSPLNVTAKPIY